MMRVTSSSAFSVDSFALAASSRSRVMLARVKESTLKAEELVTRIIYLNYSDAAKSIDVAKSSLSPRGEIDRKSTRLNSSHGYISYAVFCLKKKKQLQHNCSEQHRSLSRGGGD